MAGMHDLTDREVAAYWRAVRDGGVAALHSMIEADSEIDRSRARSAGLRRVQDRRIMRQRLCLFVVLVCVALAPLAWAVIR